MAEARFRGIEQSRPVCDMYENDDNMSAPANE